MNLRYFSGCSGIEAASLAWTPLGWAPVAFCEIDPFPSAVLAHHYPGVPNLGDMTCVDGKAYRGLVDVLVAGTPCQSYSVAGLRLGLSDERGNLTLKFVELADAIEPSVAVVWENVPGVLSSKDNAFGCFLGGLAGSDGPLVPARPGKWPNAGYVLGPRRSIAWRVLDAQYFGLAQRRRRVYVVACPRNGLDPAEILFEFDGVRRDTPPSRETGENIAGTVEASLGRSRGAGTAPGACVEVCQSLTRSLGSGGPDDNKAQAGFYISQYSDAAASLTSEGADASPCADRGPTVIAYDTTQITSPHNGSNPKPGAPCHAVSARAHPPTIIAFHGSQDPDVSGEISHPVGRNQGQETCIALLGGQEQQAWVPEIVQQAISCKWSKGTSGPAGDEHHNLICGPVATTVTARDPSRGADSVYSTSGAGAWRPEIGPLRARPQDSHENLCVALQAGALRENPASGPQSKGYQHDLAYTLEARAEVQAIAFTERGRAKGRSLECQEEQAYCQQNPGGGRSHSLQIMTKQMQVRRLSPVESERLQGIPDNYTRIAWRGRAAEECPDGPRYKAVGNSMPTKVMRWIGERIERAILRREASA